MTLLHPEEFQPYARDILRYHVALAVIDDGWPQSFKLDAGNGRAAV